MKIIFFGSDDFAKVHLEALIGSKHEVVACVTQPDRPKGRGMKVTVSPIKEYALANAIPVLQPDDVKEASLISALKDYQSDLFVVIAYGRILPTSILEIPTHFSINVHGSLLPKYRGAAPINWAIINGEKESGLSIIKMNARMDAGDVLSSETIKIQDQDTSQTLREKMMKAGPKLLLKTINDIGDGRVKPVAQDDSAVTIAAKLTKQTGKIDWNQKAQDIHNLVRGLIPWPTAYTTYKGKVLKLLSTDKVDLEDSNAKPGEVVGVDKNGITVAAQDQGILIKRVHLEASTPMDAQSFVVGHKLESGHLFQA